MQQSHENKHYFYFKEKHTLVAILKKVQSSRRQHLSARWELKH